MASVFDVAECVLSETGVSTMKLQKLVFYSQGLIRCRFSTNLCFPMTSRLGPMVQYVLNCFELIRVCLLSAKVTCGSKVIQIRLPGSKL